MTTNKSTIKKSRILLLNWSSQARIIHSLFISGLKGTEKSKSMIKFNAHTSGLLLGNISMSTD